MTVPYNPLDGTDWGWPITPDSDPDYNPPNPPTAPIFVNGVPLARPPVLSRRDIFAIEALRAIAANGTSGTYGEMAQRAVELADKLLAKLDKPKS